MALPFSKRLEKVMEYARQEAYRLSHEHIAAAHIFVGILRMGQGVVAELLFEHGVNLDDFRDKALKYMPQLYSRPVENLVCSRVVNKAFRRAEERANEYGDEQLCPIHVVLGLFYALELHELQMLWEFGIRAAEFQEQLIFEYGEKQWPKLKLRSYTQVPEPNRHWVSFYIADPSEQAVLREAMGGLDETWKVRSLVAEAFKKT